MIVTTYICDKCKKEASASDIYSMRIERGVKTVGCAPIVYNTKHICVDCLEELFPDIHKVAETLKAAMKDIENSPNLY